MNEDDGRFIDPTVGLLGGEAAEQKAPERRGAEGAVPYDVWDRMPSARPSDEPTYYDRPMLKEPVWIWAVPAYFFVGGVAGASSVLGAAAQVVDRRGMRGLIRKCRRLSASGTAIGAAFLIYDLGRPERFLNMLRVFRPTSAMNMGSWILASAGSLSAAAAVLSRDGRWGRLADVAGLGAGAVGMPLTGYTAVLLSDTAVPLWQQARRTLPFLFVASAMSSAASALELTSLDDDEETIVRRFGSVAEVAELVAVALVQKELRTVEGLDEPLRRGVGGSLWRASKALTVASLGASVASGRSRSTKAAAAAAGLVGGVALRFAMFYAGKASAKDPKASFRMQRAGHGGAEVTGRAAVTGPGGERAVPRR